MRYPELTTFDFICCFENCAPDMLLDKGMKEYFEDYFDQFCEVVDELLQQKLLLDILNDDSKVETRLSKTDYKRYLQAKERWKQPFNAENLVMNIREKSKTGNLYDAPMDELTLDEVFILTCFPFSSRLGTTFGYEFALDGRLGSLLQVLKAKDEEEDNAERLRQEMYEMESRGEYHFYTPIHLMSYQDLQRYYLTALDYLSDMRTSSDYMIISEDRFSGLTSLIPELEAMEDCEELVLEFFNGQAPTPLPSYSYVPLVDTVYDNARQIIEALPYGELIKDPEEYLYSIGIDYRHIKEVDISEQDEYCILAMLMHIYSHERFGEGYIGHFYRHGYVLKWIKRLEEIDNEWYGKSNKTMTWDKIMSMIDPHEALKRIEKKVAEENLPIEELEAQSERYAKLHGITVEEMAFYPNGGKVLDPHDILTEEYEAIGAFYEQIP